MDFVVL